MQNDNVLERQVEEAAQNLSPAAERTAELINQVWGMLPLLAVAAFAIVLFWAIGRFLSTRRFLIGGLSGGSQLIGQLLRRVIQLLFLGLGIVFALNILDAIAILSAILGAAGVVGIAVGFAIRDTIENFIASVMLSVRQPFRAKDFVDIDGKQGAVVRLTSRATILLTLDGNHLRIPNAQVFKAVITNFSRNAERRITFVLGIDAADDPQDAQEAGLEKMRALPFVLSDPKPNAWVEEVGDSNIVINYAFWIDQQQTDFLKARSAAIRIVKIELEKQGFTLPEPIYRLRFDNVPNLAGAVVETSSDEPSPKTSERAGGGEADEVIGDTTPDTTIGEKVDEERSVGMDEDLLNDDAPTEFGDAGEKSQEKTTAGPSH